MCCRNDHPGWLPEDRLLGQRVELRAHAPVGRPHQNKRSALAGQEDGGSRLLHWENGQTRQQNTGGRQQTSSEIHREILSPCGHPHRTNEHCVPDTSHRKKTVGRCNRWSDFRVFHRHEYVQYL